MGVSMTHRWNRLQPFPCRVLAAIGRSTVRRIAIALLFGLMTLPATKAVAGEAIPGESVDYVRDIKPIFRKRCYACHGVLKSESGLRLDTAAAARRGGDSGAGLVPNTPGESLLLQRVVATDPDERMPPEGEPLTPAQIAKLTAWIEQGAEAPTDEQPEEDPRDHWSFRPPVRPELPPVEDFAWGEHPIDRFIARQHGLHGLTPRPPADKARLLRRVSLDLTGLPPTRDELHAFLADRSPDAYERVVDRLLDSPQYGERWARHWMDVWRYADWFGRRMVPDVWNSAPQIWRWRDWIVTSLNEDKSYARMIQEMLAADEIAPDDPDAAVATGFLIRNWYALNPNDWMRSNVEHTAKAFLGLTYNCAHCHDHKYDPITQDDYFRLRAFFEPIGIRQDRVPGEADPGPFQDYEYGVLRKIARLGAVSIYDKHPEAPTWFYSGGDERNRDTERGSIAPGFPAIFSPDEPQIEPVELPPVAYYPAMRPAIRATILREHREAVATRQRELADARQATEARLPGLREQLASAEAAFADAVRNAQQEGRPTALSGQQSLVLDATSGRRLVNHHCQELTSLEPGTTIRFDLLLVKDSHFNFQLTKDVVQGWTAGYVGFVDGRIISYQPGTFEEFEVGRYDFAGGQTRFQVGLRLQPDEDQCMLTVRSQNDQRLLVEDIPVALNAWNPVGDPAKAISFDVRPGTVALIDDVGFFEDADASDDVGVSTPLLAFDFEPPGYVTGQDVVGSHGWSGSSFAVMPATSFVFPLADVSLIDDLMHPLTSARQAVKAQELGLQVAEMKATAARLALASVEARAAADRACYAESPPADAESLASAAIQAERAAAIQAAQMAVVEQEQRLAAAQAKPADDAKHQEGIDAASKKLEELRKVLTDAQAAPTPTSYTPLGPLYTDHSTGRRKVLAEWIGSRDNPLTARVAVNHIWMRHFHAPLVSSVFDFGRNGAAPTHPQLIDWLAVEFMDSGWSMKHLHRLIVTSRAYRMTSSQGDDAHNAEVDPQNRFLWRMNVGRMEAEVVRDSLLSCAGKLDPLMGGQELENKEAMTTYRRSLYYSCQPESDGKSPLGALFDAPDANDCYRRTRSVIPQQALALANSDLVHALSISLADTLLEQREQSVSGQENAASDASSAKRAFIVAAYEQILSRPPTSAELATCVDFMARQQELSSPQQSEDSLRHAAASLVRVLFNHNDFVGIR